MLSKVTRRLGVALIVGVAAALLEGCAGMITYGVDERWLPALDSRALVEAWPIHIGVHHAPGLRDAEMSASELASFVFGRQVLATFDWALRQRFASVSTIDTLPPGRPAPPGIAGIVSLTAVRGYWHSRQIMYDVELRAPDGQLLESWTVTGTAAADAAAGPILTAGGVHVAWMIRDTTAVLLVGLGDRDTVRAWRNLTPGPQQAPIPPAAPEIRFTSGESAVVFVRDPGDWLYGEASDAQRCLGEPFQQLEPTVPVVPFDRLRLALFPWLEWSVAPTTDEALLALLGRPEIARELARMRVRYLVHAGGATTMTVDRGGLLCGATMSGGGCFGFSWGTRDSAYHATVVDLAFAAPMGSETVRRSSGVYVPSFVIPVPIIGPTRADACREMAGLIHARITSRSREQVPAR